MDNEFEELESELKQLRPRVPSRELSGRIEGALAPSAQSERRRQLPVDWLALAAAAVVMIAFAVVNRLPSDSPETPPVASFKPVEAENVLLAAVDEGYTTLADGTPARRLRQSYIDTITWKDARTNASLTWSVPREEVRVVPVIFQ
jgi:hypothetical protein